MGTHSITVPKETLSSKLLFLPTAQLQSRRDELVDISEQLEAKVSFLKGKLKKLREHVKGHQHDLNNKEHLIVQLQELLDEQDSELQAFDLQVAELKANNSGLMQENARLKGLVENLTNKNARLREAVAIPPQVHAGKSQEVSK